MNGQNEPAYWQRIRSRQVGRLPIPVGRRTFLRGAGVALTGVGAAALVGCGTEPATDRPGVTEGPPEVQTIRLPKTYEVACLAPLVMAREFLPGEGFSNVEYVLTPNRYSDVNEQLRTGKIDFAFNFAPPLAAAIANGDELVILGGAHVACFEIFASDGVQSIGDLRGKKVAITERDPSPVDFVFIKSVLQYIGLDSRRDVELVSRPDPFRASAELRDGRLGAIMVTPPAAQSFRDAGAGHVLLNSMVDQPWSQYYCCLIATRRQFLRDNPIATRRALRAILRGIDVTRAEPERTARAMHDEAWLHSYEYGLESMKMLGYGAWRTYSPEDALRFYALRLREAGEAKMTPDEIISRGTDWHMFDALREELAFAPTPGPRRAGFFECDIPAPPHHLVAMDPFRPQDSPSLVEPIPPQAGL